MRRRRRRAGHGSRWLIALAMTYLTVHVYLPELRRFARRGDVRAALVVVCLVCLLYVVSRVRRFVRRRRRLNHARVSDRRRDYLIEDADFRRAIPKETAYRRAMQLSLLATFNNACAKCGRQDDGVDLDHFFLPKSAGGCFIMRHADGYLVNNAIPLCVHCNRAKSDKSYREFFGGEQLVVILERNLSMTKQLNARPPLDAHGRVPARVRRAAHSPSQRKTAG